MAGWKGCAKGNFGKSGPAKPDAPLHTLSDRPPTTDYRPPLTAFSIRFPNEYRRCSYAGCLLFVFRRQHHSGVLSLAVLRLGNGIRAGLPNGATGVGRLFNLLYSVDCCPCLSGMEWLLPNCLLRPLQQLLHRSLWHACSKQSGNFRQPQTQNGSCLPGPPLTPGHRRCLPLQPHAPASRKPESTR